MKVVVIFGTRPEAIKLAPVVLALKAHSGIQCRICVTAQHREMLDQVLQVFGITPDTDLNMMQPNQSLASLTARGIEMLDAYVRGEQPAVVLVQGDTTTTFVAALAAFYNHVPVAHVEAGLRTGDLAAPWPEEANRVLTSRLAALHFAPTESNRRNLIEEGVAPERIHVTGNTVIDALLLARDEARRREVEIAGLDPRVLDRARSRSIVLITGHRRESFGEGFVSICEAIYRLAQGFPDGEFVYPVHPNPNVRPVVERLLHRGPGRLANIHVIDPLPYLAFVSLMDASTVILTDSGGVQEEAPSLGKPVLVMRDTTERPEAVEAGAVKLVGTKTEDIVRETTLLLTDAGSYRAMARAINPYGDGKATGRILDALFRWLRLPA